MRLKYRGSTDGDCEDLVGFTELANRSRSRSISELSHLRQAFALGGILFRLFEVRLFPVEPLQILDRFDSFGKLACCVDQRHHLLAGQCGRNKSLWQ